MKISSERVVVIALTCNVIILSVKGAAAWLSGSSAIFSEALHSLADIINGLMLLIGIRRALRPADRQHPFGYTRAIYFWGLVGAFLMFGVISSMSFVRAYGQIMHGEDIAYIEYALASVLVSMLLEGVSVYYAVRGVMGSGQSVADGRKGLLASFRDSGDPAVKMVLVEDILSLSGVVIAFAGLLGVMFLGVRQIDGYAGVVIGFVIGVFAIYLIDENRKKLLGESASREMEEAIRKYALADPDILDVINLRTTQVGADKVMVYLVIELEPKLLVENVHDITRSIEKRIVDGIPEVIDCFIELGEGDSVPKAVTKE